MKVNSELSFHFNLRLGKTTNSNELKPIYVRITLNGKRGNFSTKLFAPPAMWSKDVEQLKLKYPEADRINKALTEISSKICEVYKEAKTQKDSVNLDDFKYNVFSNGKNIKALNKPEINPTLDWLIDKFNKDLYHKFESNVLSKGSVRSYVSSFAKLQEFFKKYYASKSFRLTDLSKQIFAEYEAYLIREKKHSRNYTYKLTKNIKRLVNHSYEMGWIQDKIPFSFTVSYRHPRREILTLSEIKAMEALEIDDPKIRDARECAIFQCYTGLAFSELFHLKKENIITNFEKKWIVINRKKTGTESKLVLLPSALKVLERNEFNPYCIKHNRLLPVRGNSEYNRDLKVLKRMCSINFNLNSHSLRHSFSTSVALSLGLPMETLSKVLGHTNLRTTMIYGKILDTKINDDFDRLASRLNDI